MKKIIRLTESDLVRIVKRIIKEQGPYAPGMGPKTQSTELPGVNPTNKSVLKPTPDISVPKVGDVWTIYPEGNKLKIKLTKATKEEIGKNDYGKNSTQYGLEGVVVSSYGDFEPGTDTGRMYTTNYQGKKVKLENPKSGDPIEIWNFYFIDGKWSGDLTYSLPNTYGENGYEYDGLITKG